MPRITRPQVYRVVPKMLPRERFGPNELLRWLEETQECNERARRSHAKRRAAWPTRPSRTTPQGRRTSWEVAESIAEQVIPYNCQATAGTGTAVDARCNLSFSLNHPLELRIEAPFRVNMSTTGRDIFGRTTPVVQESNPIISEMAVNGLSLDKLNEAEAKTGEVKETIGNVGSEIRNLLGN